MLGRSKGRQVRLQKLEKVRSIDLKVPDFTLAFFRRDGKKMRQ
jgi:hypothetical protein